MTGSDEPVELGARLPLNEVTDATASAGAVGVESLVGGSFDLGFLSTLLSIRGADFTLAPFNLNIPITRSKKQNTIIGEIYEARDADGATSPELAAALTKLVRFH